MLTIPPTPVPAHEYVASALLGTALQAMFVLPGHTLTETVHCYRVTAKRRDCRWSITGAAGSRIEGTARVDPAGHVTHLLPYDPEARR